MAPAQGPLVLDALRLLADRMPLLVLPFLKQTEAKLTRTLKTFRTTFTEPLVCGTDEDVLSPAQAERSAAAGHGKHPADETIGMWSALLPRFSDRSVSGVKSQVYLLPDFAGDLERSPFHTIVQNCPVSVFESRIMLRTVELKWDENVWPLQRWVICHYVFALALASAAMLTNHGILQLAMLVTESLSVCGKVYWRTGVCCARTTRKDSTPPLSRLPDDFAWEVASALTSCTLITTYWLYAASYDEAVREVGAVGIAAKWLVSVSFLRSSKSTGSFVRMISAIFTAIAPFLVLVGLTFAAARPALLRS